MTRALSVTTPSDTEIVMTREFDAPRRLVWEAMNRPDLVRKWLYAPEGWSMTTCEMDATVGGKFRWAWNGPDGKPALAIYGVNREVDPPVRCVHTETMEMCGRVIGELLATMELTEEASEEGPRTTLHLTLSFPNKEARDGALASGMEHGMSIGYDKLDELLASGQVTAR